MADVNQKVIIALLGKTNQLHWLENIADACRRQGLETHEICYNQLGLIQDVKRNLFKRVSKKKSIDSNITFIRRQIHSVKPDVILVVSPFLLPFEISMMLDEFESATRMAWIGDRIIDEHIPLCSNYDWLFMTDSGFVEIAKSHGLDNTSYLPLAANEQVFYPRNQSRHDRLLFVASCTGQRVDILNRVAEKHKLKLIGNRWKRAFADNKNIELLDRLIDNQQLAAEYNHANFILNIRHESNVINGLNMRSFEGPAAGSCVLQDYVKDIELNFEPDKEIVVYQDADDLSRQMDRLMSDRQYLQSIQQNGYKRVIAEHTYTHRLRQIAVKVF